MRNKFAAAKDHVDQNRHHIRDLAIAASVLGATTVVILKLRNTDSDALKADHAIQ